MIERLAGERRAWSEEILKAAADVEAGFGVRSFEAVFGRSKAIHADAGGDVWVEDTALPVVDDVAVDIEGLHCAGEALPNDVPPGGAELAADRHARRQVPFDGSRDVEPVVERSVGGDIGADRGANGKHAGNGRPTSCRAAPLRRRRCDADDENEEADEKNGSSLHELGRLQAEYRGKPSMVDLGLADARNAWAT